MIRRRGLAAFIVCMPLLLAACSATRSGGNNGLPPPLESVGSVTESGLTCAQATGVARRAMLKLGYTIDSVEPAKPGAPGRVVGIRHTGWTPRIAEEIDVYRLEFSVQCSDAGATFDAATSEGFTRRLSLRRDIPPALSAVIEQPVRRPKVSEEPEQGLIISIEAKRSRDASAIFGVDLPTAGITPVQFKIDNRTERTYGFSRTRVKLVTQDGHDAPPLREKDLIAKLGAPATAQLTAKLIGEGDLAPGNDRAGFMYFPAAAYHRATVILLDRENDEPEGFNVEF